MSRVKTNESHSFLMDLVLYHLGNFILYFAVASVPPPNENVGVIEDCLSYALIFVIKASG